jgi:hypothetical protein
MKKTNPHWQEFENKKRESFEQRLAKTKDLFLLETALLESSRDLVPPEFLSLLQSRFEALRTGKSDPRAIFFRYRRDRRLFSLLEVISAAYAFASYSIEGKVNQRAKGTLRSWSSSCDSDVQALFKNMKASKGVKLPDCV